MAKSSNCLWMVFMLKTHTNWCETNFVENFCSSLSGGNTIQNSMLKNL
jgi:hypothetical protein